MATALALKDTLLDSAKEVFESMVFMPLSFVDEEMPATGDAMLLWTITFV